MKEKRERERGGIMGTEHDDVGLLVVSIQDGLCDEGGELDLVL